MNTSVHQKIRYNIRRLGDDTWERFIPSLNFGGRAERPNRHCLAFIEQRAFNGAPNLGGRHSVVTAVVSRMNTVP